MTMIYLDKHPSTVRVRNIPKDILQVLQLAVEGKMSAKIHTLDLHWEVFFVENTDFNAFSTSGDKDLNSLGFAEDCGLFWDW